MSQLSRVPHSMPHPAELLAQDGTALGRKFLAHLRGGRMEPLEVIHERSLRFLRDRFFIPFGSVYLPEKAYFEGICCVGSPGSGKSVLIRQLMRNRLSHVGRGFGHRAFIWSFKGNERAYLDGLELACPLHYINPLDVNGKGVNLAAELTTTLQADAFAKALITPDGEEGEGDRNATFTKAGCGIVAEVIKAFIQEADGGWNLMDVLEACQDEGNLRRVLSMTRRGISKLNGTLGAVKQAKGIMITLDAACTTLEPLAAAMLRSENISLLDWVEGQEAALVLQNVKRYQTCLGPFFRWVFRHTFDLIMSRRKDRGETYDFFLDEARWAPFATDIVELATLGRESRCGFVLGFTDVQGMKRVLKAEGVGELFSGCSTQAWFQNNDPESAEFGAKRFGRADELEAEHSVSVGDNQSSNAFNLDPAKKAKIRDEDFRRRYDDELRRARQDVRPGQTPPDMVRMPLEERVYREHDVIPNGSPISESTTVNTSRSVSVRSVEHDLVPTSLILHGEKPNPLPEEGEDLVTQCHVASTFLGNWKEVTSGMQEVTLAKDMDVTVFEPRPNSELRFLGWDEDDEDRLGMLRVADSPAPSGR